MSTMASSEVSLAEKLKSATLMGIPIVFPELRFELKICHDANSRSGGLNASVLGACLFRFSSDPG